MPFFVSLAAAEFFSPGFSAYQASKFLPAAHVKLIFNDSISAFHFLLDALNKIGDKIAFDPVEGNPNALILRLKQEGQTSETAADIINTLRKHYSSPFFGITVKN
jgi:hypothetical protein